MTGLLDTAVLVDLLRGYPPAVAWLGRQGRLGSPAPVWLELIEGARDRRAQSQALELLVLFERVDLTEADSRWAIERALQFRLSHRVDAFDCLIAAPVQWTVTE